MEYATDFSATSALGRDLIAGWQRYVDSHDDHFTFGQRQHRPSEGRFGVVFALAAHLHQLAPIALDLLERDAVLEATPLVRLMYESALKAVWMQQHEHAWVSFIREEARTREAIQKTLARGKPAWMKNGADGFPGIDLPDWDPGSDAQARNFERLCDDLAPGGAEAYVIYRLLSRLSHPSAHLADRYSWANDNGEWQGVRPTPDRARDDRDLITYFAVASLIWAGTAVDYMDPPRTRRSETREAAKRLGIPRDLHLTPQALARAASRPPKGDSK